MFVVRRRKKQKKKVQVKIMIYLLLTIITTVAANTCPLNEMPPNIQADPSNFPIPAKMGTAPTETPLCETVQTGSCSGVFGSDTACVEKPPADKSWSAQQYLDVMSALDSKMVMEQLIASLPPYAECGVNHTDAYKETCKRYYL